MRNALKSKRFLLIVVICGLIAVAGGGTLYVRAAASGEKASQQASEAEKPATTDEAEGKPAVPVSVTKVASATVASYVSATANLVPENDVKVLAEADGRVTHLLVEEGDRVRKGQLLAALDRRDAEIAQQKSRLRADNARTAYERAQRLAAEDLVTDSAFDTTVTEHKLAEQELAETAWRLEKTEIRAPFDGRVTQRLITVGQHVSPGAELFQVTDFDPLVARIYLPEKDVIALAEGRAVRLTLKADERISFQGRIRQISPVVDPATGTVKVTVEASATPTAVRPGGFVRVDIVRETRDNALVVPREAVIRELQSAHLFVVNDGLASRREVSLGIEDGERREVLSGVSEGEQVVIAGQGSLKEGTAVKVVDGEAVPAGGLMASL